MTTRPADGLLFNARLIDGNARLIDGNPVGLEFDHNSRFSVEESDALEILGADRKLHDHMHRIIAAHREGLADEPFGSHSFGASGSP
jgi:hypothetical protein